MPEVAWKHLFHTTLDSLLLPFYVVRRRMALANGIAGGALIAAADVLLVVG